MQQKTTSQTKSDLDAVDAGDCRCQRLLPMAVVVELTTYSRPSIYRLIDQGRFPVPLKLGGGKIAFREAEILEWLESRPRAMSPNEP